MVGVSIGDLDCKFHNSTDRASRCKGIALQIALLANALSVGRLRQFFGPIPDSQAAKGLQAAALSDCCVALLADRENWASRMPE